MKRGAPAAPLLLPDKLSCALLRGRRRCGRRGARSALLLEILAGFLGGLTQDFIKSGFSVRHLLGVIANSRVYQQSIATNRWNVGRPAIGTRDRA